MSALRKKSGMSDDVNNYLVSALIVLVSIAICLIIVLLLLVGEASCQEAADNPQPRCQTVSMNEQGDLIYQDVPCSTVPNWHELKATSPRVTFWTVQPNRSNAQTLKTPWTWGTMAVSAGLTIADYEREGKSSGPVDAFVPMASVFALHYVSDRWWARFIGVAAEGYLAGIHIHGLATGRWH